ncbi:peptidylprolyl isomerase [Falsihalocynthiibacter sp. S25ZX9]|uniref:peptidylprolyl isomerase n=1 Tax=unclassified Falsihalocynthiibacter TaxID=2854191 RepID=UPI00350FFFE9
MDKSKGELMLKHTKIGIFAVLLATTSVAVAQDTPPKPEWGTVVATVNGMDITIGHMIIARETLPQQYLTLEDGVLFEGILENLIQQNILAQSVKGNVSLRDQTAMDNQTRSYMAGSAVDAVLATAVTQEKLEALFNETYIGGEPEMEFNAAHILLEKKEEADLVVQLLDAGSDFAELAREKSTGPSGPNGGNLGWFSKGAMVPAFEEAVIALEDGTYSAPVESEFGWHVIHRIESRVQDAPTFEDVRDELEAELQQRALAEAVEALEGNAEITRTEVVIDPTVLQDPEIVGK